jgi:hypothetical protein
MIVYAPVEKRVASVEKIPYASEKKERRGSDTLVVVFNLVSVFVLRGAQGHSLRGMVAHPKCVHLGWAPDLLSGV